MFEFIKILIVITRREKEEVDIAFPFKYGKYLITDGGDSRMSRMMNYHYYSPVHRKKKTSRSMRFATDVIKIDKKKAAFFPKKNEDYPVFGEKLYAPMDGYVLKVINDIDDNIPFSGNYPYHTGNTVVIKKDEYYFLLGHMKKGSIPLHEGERISRHDPIGEAGNSGMSERPHLHMQLMKSKTDDYWKGEGICIRFNRKNLFKNRILRV